MRKTLFFCVLIFILVIPAFSQGTEEDPVICRSYLENFYNWREVSMVPGQALSLDLGVNFVLVKGRVTIVGVGLEGLVDLTEGKVLRDGDEVASYHLIICPSGDGRGIKTEEDTVILIKGLKKY